MFIEGIVLNALNNTPVAMDPEDNSFYGYETTLTIYNEEMEVLYSDTRYAQNSSSSFTYKLESDVAEG